MELSKITLEIFSRLEQKWLSHCEDKKTRILSIDGGGTKGIIAGAALIHLEDQIQAKTGDSQSRIIDFFDILAGTGIGAIFSAMLTADDGNGRPLFTARDAVKFVQEKHSEMFKIKHEGILRRRRRFSSKKFDKVLKEALSRENGKVLTLKDTCKPLLVPCYDLNSSAPFVFSRADAAESPSFDFELWKACRATSATPSLFKPFHLTSIDGKTSCLAIDGGLVMNNPTAAAVTHALHNKRDFPSVNGVEDLLVLSLGNGPLSGPSPSPLRRQLHRNGECSTTSVVGIVLDGISETVDQMLGNAFCWNRTDYVRIQANGFVSQEVELTMDGMLKERGVESLPFGGKRLLTETNGQRIKSFVQRLVASGKSSLPPSPCKETAVSSLVNGR
ncbi:probable inactive patatin-like protein 9 [Telopea speciosissima]|uniref:probable inactive patatin-like protein 9 n=1 Tax=Telopea speciosissima TaxID=54955 RepID=UPI001CC4AEB0|nr:probable inactive patatin-like protein 9 [Telopea speciosissima]XP_043690712.1 probable inactive patatin-like protein 9 [Telopea speciosissima]